MTKARMSHTHEEIRAQNTHSRVTEKEAKRSRERDRLAHSQCTLMTEKEANRSWARSRAHSCALARHRRRRRGGQELEHTHMTALTRQRS
jgi:hypothetical protein